MMQTLGPREGILIVLVSYVTSSLISLIEKANFLDPKERSAD